MASKSRSNLSETSNKESSPATPNKAPSSATLNKPATPNKASPATPRVSKLSKGVSKPDSESPSPLQTSRLSAEKSSPRSVNSKPIAERKSPRPTTPADKQIPRVAKSSELQTQLNVAQEDLKKAKEKLSRAEKEKEKAINELKEAQKVAEEANEKLREATVAQKRAEENSEIEKFRAVELEQAGIEAAQKKEKEWQNELESVRNQHALDVSALLSTNQELQRVKQELVMTCDAKNQALSHADDATKIAELHVEKAEILSAELARLKSLLDSKLETEASESKLVLELQAEIEALKKELEKAKGYDEILTEKETYIEQLNVEFEAAKMAESYAHSVLEEWTKKVEELEIRVEEANELERSASFSLESAMKQLEVKNQLLHDTESEISSLKEKVGILEVTIGKQRGDLEDSERCLLVAKEENLEMSKEVESLKSELETVNEEKTRALKNEKLAASNLQTLLEEKNKLINELQISRDEEEKSKKAMEGLASALHEVSAEARDAKEKLLANYAEHESYKTQIEDLKSVLEASNKKYESMLDDARREIDALTSSVENSKHDMVNSKAEWEQKEDHLVSCLKRTEEENSSLGKEINRLINLLKETEEEASSKREEEAQLKENLKEVEAEAIHLQEALKEAHAENMKAIHLQEALKEAQAENMKAIHLQEALKEAQAENMKAIHLQEALKEAQAENMKAVHLQEALKEAQAENMKLKESLLDKENEFQNIFQENEDLRSRESATIKKVEELSKLLEEATTRNQTEENGDLTDSEKDYDLLPKVVEFFEENGHVAEDIPKANEELSTKEGLKLEETLQEENINIPSNDKFEKFESPKAENVNEKVKEDEVKEKDEFKMWESCKIEKKEFSPERVALAEAESFEEEADSVSKIESVGDGDHTNGASVTVRENIDDGGSSPSKQQVKKKKKPLLGKFGSLLKKKSGSNHK